MRVLLAAMLLGVSVALGGVSLAYADNCTNAPDTQKCSAAINATAWGAAAAAAIGAAAGGKVLTNPPTVKLEGTGPTQAAAQKALDEKLKENCETGLAQLQNLANDITKECQEEIQFKHYLERRIEAYVKLKDMFERQINLGKLRSLAWTVADVSSTAATIVAAVPIITAALASQFALAPATIMAIRMGSRPAAYAVGTLEALQGGLASFSSKYLFGPNMWVTAGQTTVAKAGISGGKKAVGGAEKVLKEMEKLAADNEKMNLDTEHLTGLWQDRVFGIERLSSSYRTLYDRWMEECGGKGSGPPPDPGQWAKYLHGTWGDQGITQPVLKLWTPDGPSVPPGPGAPAPPSRPLPPVRPLPPRGPLN